MRNLALEWMPYATTAHNIDKLENETKKTIRQNIKATWEWFNSTLKQIYQQKNLKKNRARNVLKWP